MRAWWTSLSLSLCKYWVIPIGLWVETSFRFHPAGRSREEAALMAAWSCGVSSIMGEVVFELPFRNCSQKSCGLTSACSASWNSQECEPIFSKGEWIPTACNIPKKHSRGDVIAAFFFFFFGSLYRSRAWEMGAESIDISIDTKTEWRWGSDAAYASSPQHLGYQSRKMKSLGTTWATPRFPD